MATLGTGLHDFTREQYDRIARVNWSRLKLLGKSPALYRYIMENPPEPDTDARARGRITHLAAFEPQLLEEVAIWKGRRAGKEWEAFEKENKVAGREVVTENIYKEAIAIGRAARSSPMALPYLSGGRGEVSMLWRHESPPLEGTPGYHFDCKARVDFIAKAGALVDLKTTRSAAPVSAKGFFNEAAQYEYHAQLAFYADGYEAAVGVRLPVVIVAVETTPPYVVQVYTVGEEILEFGRDRYRTLLDHLNHCNTNSEYLGYAPGPIPLQLPKWAVPFDEDDGGDLGLVIGG